MKKMGKFAAIYLSDLMNLGAEPKRRRRLVFVDEIARGKGKTRAAAPWNAN